MVREDSSISLNPENLKKGGNIVIGTLNIFTSPVKKKLEEHYKTESDKFGYWHLITDIVLAAIILFLAIFNIWILTSGEWGLSKKIDLNINLDQAISGQSVTYTINYKNNSKSRLKETTLAVNFPPGLVNVSVEPSSLFSSPTNTFNLGQIDPGANGEVRIKGILFGDANLPSVLGATLNFLPENSARHQQKNAVRKDTVTESLVKGEIIAPDKVSSGQIFDLAIKYINGSEWEIPLMNIVENFKEAGLETDVAGALTVEDIKPKTEGEIKLKGKFILNKESRKVKLTSSLQIVLGQIKLLQPTTAKEIEVIPSKLVLELIPEKSIVSLGENINYTLKYQNQEDFDIVSAKFILKTDPEITGGVILGPGLILSKKSGEIKFSAKIKELKLDRKNPVLESWIEADYRSKQDPDLQSFAFSGKQEQKIKTNLVFKAFARYYTAEGDQLGVGPLPPQAGQTTKYWIFLSLENCCNDAKDIAITARLPKNVSLTDKTSTTEDQGIKYDENSREISWKISKIKAPSNFFPSVGSVFEIALTPSAEQAGQTALLLENIRLTAMDEFTSEVIAKNLDNITTNLILDALETRGGIIRK